MTAAVTQISQKLIEFSSFLVEIPKYIPPRILGCLNNYYAYKDTCPHICVVNLITATVMLRHYIMPNSKAESQGV